MLQTGDVDYRKTTLGKGDLKETAGYDSAHFLKYHSRSSVGSANIESVSQAQTVKLCVEAPSFLSKSTKHLKNYLAKINILYIRYILTHATACFQPWPCIFLGFNFWLLVKLFQNDSPPFYMHFLQCKYIQLRLDIQRDIPVKVFLWKSRQFLQGRGGCEMGMNVFFCCFFFKYREPGSPLSSVCLPLIQWLLHVRWHHEELQITARQHWLTNHTVHVSTTTQPYSSLILWTGKTGGWGSGCRQR